MRRLCNLTCLLGCTVIRSAKTSGMELNRKINLLRELPLLTTIPPVRFVKDISTENNEDVTCLQSDIRHSNDLKDQKDDEWKMDPSASQNGLTQQFERIEDKTDNPGICANVQESTTIDVLKHSTEFTELTQRFRNDICGLNHESMIQKLRTMKSGLRGRSLSWEVDTQHTKLQSNDERKKSREKYAKLMEIRKSKRKIMRWERKNKHIFLDVKNLDDDGYI